VYERTLRATIDYKNSTADYEMSGKHTEQTSRRDNAAQHPDKPALAVATEHRDPHKLQGYKIAG